MTAGAALSHVTLQSASERIRGMESELGVPLLHRVKQGVTLTDAGYALANHAHIVLQQMDNLHSDSQQYGEGLRGHIELLCNSAAQSEYLPAVLGPYLLARPTMSVAVKEMQSAQIVAALVGQTANLGIVADATALHGLATRPFRDDALVVVAPPDSPWRGRDVVAFDDILDGDFVGLTAGSALQDHIDAHAGQRGRRLHYRVRLASVDAVMQLVGQGVGLAIVPRHAAQRFVPAAAGQAIVPLSDRWADRKLVICARNFAELPGYVREFVDCIAEDANYLQAM